MLGEIRFQQDFPGRADNMVVLSPDDVLQQDGAGAAVTLDISIEGQVERNDFYAGIGFTCIVEGIAGEDV